MTSLTSEDPKGRWKRPREDIFMLSEHPDFPEPVLHGPLRVGSGSTNNAAGQSSFTLHLAAVCISSKSALLPPGLILALKSHAGQSQNHA